MKFAKASRKNKTRGYQAVIKGNVYEKVTHIFGLSYYPNCFIGIVGHGKIESTYFIEDKNYPNAENAFCGEWRVLHSETVTNKDKAYLQSEDIVIITEDEIVIGDDVLEHVRFDGTLTDNLNEQEYNDFFKEYNYVCSYFDWIQRGNFYLYIIANNSTKRMALCMSKEDYMIIRYGESIYYCKKVENEKEGGRQYFAGICRMHDFGLDGEEIFEGKWIIDQKIDTKKKILNDRDMEGQEIIFLRSDLGKIRMSFNGKMYRKVGVSMDVIGAIEEQRLADYGSSQELGLTGSLIPYVHLELDETDISRIQRFCYK